MDSNLEGKLAPPGKSDGGGDNSDGMRAQGGPSIVTANGNHDNQGSLANIGNMDTGLEVPRPRSLDGYPSINPAEVKNVDRPEVRVACDVDSASEQRRGQHHQQLPTLVTASIAESGSTNETIELQRTSLQPQQPISISSLPNWNNVAGAPDTTTSDCTATKSTDFTSDRKPLNKKHLRRKNSRRLHRLLNNPDVLPSFLKVIEGRKKIKTEPDADVTTTTKKAESKVVDFDEDFDEDFLLEPPMVVIDVDEYIGLKKKRKFSEAVLSAPLQIGSSDLVVATTASSYVISPLVTSSSSVVGATRAPSSRMSRRKTERKSPTDEGWYEGTYPMSIMPDDATHISEIQKFVRENMEYFSATDLNLASMSGRRKPTVRGQVGIRCVHCARALEAAQTKMKGAKFWNGESPKMPPGSVSYPVNFSALYSLAIQKPQHHFEHCPNLPPGLRWNDVLNTFKTTTNKNGEGSSRLRKRMKKGITAVAYWNISCRRLGIVELDDCAGLRFGRDLNLDLLPFETVRAKLEQEKPQLFPKQNQASILPRVTATGPKQNQINAFQKVAAAANVFPTTVGSMGPVTTSANLQKKRLGDSTRGKGRGRRFDTILDIQGRYWFFE